MVSTNVRVKEWRERIKIKMVECMGGKCQCCGYDKCMTALAFHHLIPTEKDFGFGQIRANPKSWEKIVNELKKCILVCHNCHSEIHSGLRIIPNDYIKFDEKLSSSSLDFNDCPICGNKKPTIRIFCSKPCLHINNQKLNQKLTLSDIELIELLTKHTVTEIAKQWNITTATIYKRRSKILKALTK